MSIKTILAGSAAAAALTVSVAVGALAGCGSASSPAGVPGSSSPAAGPASGTSPAAAFNPADVGFARGMVVLEGQSQTMAALAAGQTTTSQLRQFAAHAGDQARSEKSQLRGWLRSWNQAAPQPWSPGGTPPYPMGPGMMGSSHWNGYWNDTNRGWDAMRGLRGRAFDTGWTAMMAQGYTAQADLAQRELASGINPQARALASAVLTSRQAGLAQLHQWYDQWGGHGSGGPGQQDWWNGWYSGCCR